MDNKIEEQKEKDLIAGRIIDEFRKHSSNIEDWHKIAASKIHSQWKEYFTKQGYQTAMEDKLNEFPTPPIQKPKLAPSVNTQTGTIFKTN